MGKTFAVIGDPISHSLSPNIHTAAFRELGMECTYMAYRIRPDELEEGIHGLKSVGISGFNVTIPHKVRITRHLDRMDESASMIGAVNTVENNNGVLKGYNTDMDGFLEPLRKRGTPVRGARALLLGAGGAARAIIAGLAREKAESLVIANRTLQSASEAAEFSASAGLDARPARLADVTRSAGEYDIIINATSVGLQGEPSPISMEGAGDGTTAYDIVYMPMNTDFVKKAKDAGARIVYGYEMLLGQAARSFEIWHKTEAPYSAMKRALLGGV